MAASPLVLTAPAGPTAATGTPNPNDVPLDAFALLRDQVRGTFAFNRTSLTGHIVGAVVILLMFSATAPMALLVGWGGLFAALWVVRVWLALRFARREPSTAKKMLRRLRVWQAGVLAAGALWGAAAWLFFSHGGAPQQIALVLVVYTFCVACVPILAPQFLLFVIFVLLMFVPAVAAAVHAGLGWQLALVLTVAMGMVMVLGRNYRASFDSVIALKLRTEALAEQLRAEKGVAEAARQEAEVANRAKTQFFAAASHDLRQPLHAMGLFAEALRQRSREPEVAQLVNSINESVDALEGLFSELLDITRIDSGGVEVHPEHFGVGDIFRKLKLHYEPTAFEKGLGLRFHGQRHVLHADPLLTERILRNLVSNAIRYTADGSVLVAARRRGDHVRLQVWDTGPGIREEERVRVFEEFYQLPGTAAAAVGEQKKGLGLGLAIVKRLTALMGATVELRSVMGRGSVFTIDLPLGKTPRADPRVTPGKGPVALTLEGKLIVVVEDEPAVRAGLEVLLRGWGATIQAFESVGATRAWTASSESAAAKPALIIADYRLEAGETGVEAIQALRERFGKQLPAIVVTGSNMAGNDKDAALHDFHLLTKPVLPNKLRAMIAFKLSGR